MLVQIHGMNTVERATQTIITQHRVKQFHALFCLRRETA